MIGPHATHPSWLPGWNHIMCFRGSSHAPGPQLSARHWAALYFSEAMVGAWGCWRLIEVNGVCPPSDKKALRKSPSLHGTDHPHVRHRHLPGINFSQASPSMQLIATLRSISPYFPPCLINRLNVRMYSNNFLIYLATFEVTVCSPVSDFLMLFSKLN